MVAEGEGSEDSRQVPATASARSAYLAGRAETPVKEDPTIWDDDPPDWRGIVEPRRHKHKHGERGRRVDSRSASRGMGGLLESETEAPRRERGRESWGVEAEERARLYRQVDKYCTNIVENNQRHRRADGVLSSLARVCVIHCRRGW